ncbi:MAG: hypothetical protein EXS08_10765 [Planctomycetes bacterium]|nr:hypothetical protein [Planctomycetota bacterium]
MRTATLASVLSLALVACSHHHHDSGGGGGGIPVFVESERNDDPLTANDFGTLRPGDHFFIDGFVRDDLIDPFDGFQFLAAQPLHVDFQLFIGNATADLDVCLYDVQLDQTVACFATANDPEQGGVDVFAGGLAFQLVVESFVGDASYSLEIDVQPLFARAPQGEGLGASLVGVDARAEHATEAQQGYHKPRPGPRLVLEQSIEFDPATGLVLERLRVQHAH